jgi:formate dehydrogenase gamma subunit
MLVNSFSVGVLFLLMSTVCPVGIQAASLSNDACYNCHGKEGTPIPFVEKTTMGHSVHNKLSCVSCHRDADSMPHAQNLAPVNCILNSGHGRALKQDREVAETCADCHGGVHSIVGSDVPESEVSWGNIVNTCARCHADPGIMSAVRLSVKDPVNSYRRTVHGQAFLEGNRESAVCTDCHSTHNLFNSLDPRSRVFRKNIPDTCGRCHQEIAVAYKESIHGRAALEGVQESPVCTDCHGSYVVHSPEGTTFSAGIVSCSCSDCHKSEQIIPKFDLPADRIQTYSNSYHGLAARRGDLSVADCASCHGYHDVLPSKDPRSSINISNLAKTCGKCHPGAGSALSSGKVHLSAENKHWTLVAVQWFYWIVIPLALGVMLFHNALDWIRKAWSGTSTTVHSDDIRFTVNERCQHLLLIGSFLLLALSGFALKFPDGLWAYYLAPSSEAVRRAVHRWAALVFTLLSIYHFFYIVLTKRGRFIVREMKPCRADIKDIFGILAYNLHLRKSPPAHDNYYRYPEKIEYWSLVWGSMLMIITGSLLVFNNFTLKHFPLWVSDLAARAHYYEAILACLAIVIGHFYAVIFDPDVYPMNCAWWNGRIRCSGKRPR